MTELEAFLDKLTSIRNSIVASSHSDDVKLSLLRGALLGLLEINPDNIMSDEEKSIKWEDFDDEID